MHRTLCCAALVAVRVSLWWKPVAPSAIQAATRRLAQPSASRVRESSLPVQAAWAGRSSAPPRIAWTSVLQMPTALRAPPACPALVALAIQKSHWHSLRRNLLWTALVALSQKDAQDAVLRSAGCRESQSLMKTCGTQCYSSGDQASCSAKCLKGKGVQSSCASCLGRKIQCTVKNCLNFCAADANSPTCSSCVSRSCGSCNSEKSLTQPEEESFVTALVALSQKDAQDAVLRSAGCRESQSLMKTCGTQCYSSGDQASCSAKCLKGKGVQSSCASCLGRKIQCTVKNCLNFCAADANSPTCSSCVSRSCGSCNSEKSLTQPEEESFVTALVALSQKDAQPTVFP